jgi:hypothetical protein
MRLSECGRASKPIHPDLTIVDDHGITLTDHKQGDKKMKNRLYNFIGAGVLALAFGQHYAAFAADPNAVIPDQLKPPADNELFLKAQGVGTQNYICMPSGSGVSWAFLGPQATLFVTIPFPGREIRQQVATHFLSPNSAENGTPRPTWQGSVDTSAVWARAIVTVNDPSVVAPGAIPWLLLQVVGNRPGMLGAPGLAQTTFVQRLNTSGGVAPSTGCAATTDIGHTAFVPYSTDYYFYKAARSGF